MSESNLSQPPEQLNQLSQQELLEIIVSQQQQIQELTQEIERLKLSQNLDSQTSSTPPSTDLLKKSENNKEKPSSKKQTSTNKKAGGQPGHHGRTRKGFGHIDRYQVTRPESCPNCGNQQLNSEPIKIDKQQVAQLVSRPIEIVEHQRHHCQCAHCGAIAEGELSDQHLRGQDLGMRLQGLLCWLGNYGHLFYTKQQELLWELAEIHISRATLVATNERVQQAVAPSVEQLKQWINQNCPHLHSDETPWPVKGVKEWLWVLAGEGFCLFHAGDSRGRIELESLLGSSYDGGLISDDFSVYNGYPVAGQQKCLAHLRRHFQKLFHTKGLYNSSIAETFIALIDEAFEYHRVWKQTANEIDYQHWAQHFRKRVSDQIERWSGCAGYQAGNLLRSLSEKASQWWYFLDDPKVPPDNNLAERCLRTAVTKRKVSGGSRSLERFHQTANLLSMIQSCRLQQRSVITCFQQALQAILGHSCYPSLIPQP